MVRAFVEADPRIAWSLVRIHIVVATEIAEAHHCTPRPAEECSCALVGSTLLSRAPWHVWKSGHDSIRGSSHGTRCPWKFGFVYCLRRNRLRAFRTYKSPCRSAGAHDQFASDSKTSRCIAFASQIIVFYPPIGGDSRHSVARPFFALPVWRLTHSLAAPPRAS